VAIIALLGRDETALAIAAGGLDFVTLQYDMSIILTDIETLGAI
jgi:putative heme degradation protein